jgi:molybdenum cofactor cytidylyltransferase
MRSERSAAVAAIVLAGGKSRRFGTSKLLHPWTNVRTILEASLAAPLGAGLDRVLVVTGAYHAELSIILQRYPVQVVQNPDWEVGMSTSVKVGLRALEAGGALDAFLICLGDQPMLPPSVIRDLVDRYQTGRSRLVAPAVGDERKSPVLVDWSLVPEFLLIEGDQGGRSVVKRHADDMALLQYSEVDWFRDIDSPLDLPQSDA